MKFKFLKHTADIKFRAFGATLNKCFENSALAMFNTMYSGKVRENKKKKINIKGSDMESLLYNFLEEMLFLLDSQGFFLSSCNVKIDKEKLSLEAELFGDHAKNYEIELDVKAVTYNEMFVRKIKDKYVCQVVLDV